MKSALVCGAGGIIGSHLVKRLKRDGFWVRGVDLKFPEFSKTEADDLVKADLRDQVVCREVVDRKFDEVYQLAADMGGAGYIFTGEHDAEVMHNSATINLNMVDACRRRNCSCVFHSSSACMYPAYNQEDPNSPNCAENSAYPAFSPAIFAVERRHVPGPLGVRGRNSDNRLIKQQLGRAPSEPLRDGIKKTYDWIAAQVDLQRGQNRSAA